MESVHRDFPFLFVLSIPLDSLIVVVGCVNAKSIMQYLLGGHGVSQWRGRGLLKKEGDGKSQGKKWMGS